MKSAARFAAFLAACAAHAEVDYIKDVKPLLQERCYACHGALKQKGGLRLDTAAAIFKGGESGPAIDRNSSEKSLLLQRVTSADTDERMPPEHEGELFKEAQVAVLRAWIASGAKAPADEKPESDPRDHWAFRPRTRPAVPAVRNAAWVRNPIDAFIAAQHEQHGLAPQKEAPREVLMRRLWIDLTGIPPSAEEASAFLAADTYEATVDKLLAAPRHGERWARHWMDVWRYSDWWGLNEQLRNSQKHMWHFRDWIVESLNANVPYDEMLRQMLAADELYPADPQKLRATGFLARNFFLFNRNPWMEETVEHVSKGLLGLTMNCTKCHDHKYDPISQTDFYRMRAFFEPLHVRLDAVPGELDFEKNGIPRVFDGLLDEPTFRYIRGEESKPDKSAPIAPGVPALLSHGDMQIHSVTLPIEAAEPERQPWVAESHIAEARQKLASARTAADQARAALTHGHPKLTEAENAVAIASARLESVTKRAEAMRAQWSGSADAKAKREAAIRADQKIAVIQVQQTASSAEKAAEAEKLLTQPLGADADFVRLSGAQWTPTRFKDSTKDDPRIAFPPTSTGRRTALAAWITDARNPLTARVAVNHIWARHMGQPLVATMFDFGRKGATPTHPELLDWLASELVESGWDMRRIHRLIVTSAAYRMSSSLAGAEASSGKDPDNRHLWRRLPQRIESEVVRDSLLALSGELDATLGGPSVAPSAQENSRRRSLYFFHSNIEKNRFLATFDAADVKDCYRRDQSIVPQQALAMSNSALVHTAAEKIAARLTKSAPEEPAFIRAAWLQLLAIAPGETELAATTRSLAAWRALPGANDTTARAQFIRVLLNHNDFVTLR
ncbi:MAG: hypothetical protein RL088_1111 [Verrucomicrobiota bacterium]|jgi:hypothetical protein